jgi:hypothetical protein
MNDNAWKDAVIDAAVVDWVYKAEHEDNPRLAVADLLAHASMLALDPRVSSEAAALYKKSNKLREMLDSAMLALRLINVNNGVQSLKSLDVTANVTEEYYALLHSEKEKETNDH